MLGSSPHLPAERIFLTSTNDGVGSALWPLCSLRSTSIWLNGVSENIEMVFDKSCSYLNLHTIVDIIP